jgi:predicted amidohydrolase
MDVIKFAGLQMHVTENIQLNEAKITDALAKASKDKADFLVTPEGSLSGYRPNFDDSQVVQALERVTQAAKKLGVGLFLGTCFSEPMNGEKIRMNQIRVYSPDGAYQGYHAKILRCSAPEDPAGGEVRDYAGGALRIFDFHGIKIGALICNDLWATPGYTCLPNTYLALQLKKMGAQILVHAVNTGPDPRYRSFHMASQELWALTLKLSMVGVNASAGAMSAPSGVTGPDGKRLYTAPESGEHYFSFDVLPAPSVP